jgi:hypothetical protein
VIRISTVFNELVHNGGVAPNMDLPSMGILLKPTNSNLDIFLDIHKFSQISNTNLDI